MVLDLSQKLDRHRFWWHVLFWVVYILSITIIYGSYDDEYFSEFVIVTVQTPLTIALTYTILYFLMPRFLMKQKYVEFIIGFIASILIIGVLQRYVIHHTLYVWYFPDRATQNPLFFPRFFNTILKMFYISSVAASIKLIKQWYNNHQTNQLLHKEKLEAELKFLKSQIHPHFLFNTLNNLYALTLRKSDKAPEVVLKLSDLLNYMLYDCNAPMVSLEKEITLLNNYVSLEKIRYGDRLNAKINSDGDYTGKQIAPMLLLPLIENSFKHGLSKELADPWLNVKVKTLDHSIEILVENAKDPEKNNVRHSYTEGIGLRNVKRRLELIYPGKHKFEISDKASSFSVYLSLNID